MSRKVELEKYSKAVLVEYLRKFHFVDEANLLSAKAEVLMRKHERVRKEGDAALKRTSNLSGLAWHKSWIKYDELEKRQKRIWKAVEACWRAADRLRAERRMRRHEAAMALMQDEEQQDEAQAERQDDAA